MHRAVRSRLVLGVLLGGCWAIGLACSNNPYAEQVPQPSEAGTEASADSPTDAPVADVLPDAASFCSSVKDAIFCADFDESDVTTGFNRVVDDGGSLARTDSPQSPSPPSGLLAATASMGAAALDAATGGISAAAYVALATSNASSGVALDLDIRLDAIPAADGGFLTLFQVGFDVDKHAATVLVQNGELNMYVADAVGMATSVSVPLPATVQGGWTHLRMEVGFPGKGARLLVGGAPSTTAPGLTPSATNFFVSVGLFSHSTTPSQVAYDNVVVTRL